MGEMRIPHTKPTCVRDDTCPECYHRFPDGFDYCQSCNERNGRVQLEYWCDGKLIESTTFDLQGQMPLLADFIVINRMLCTVRSRTWWADIGKVQIGLKEEYPVSTENPEHDPDEGTMESHLVMKGAGML